MGGKIITSFLFILLVISLLSFYWFIPIKTTNFKELKAGFSNNYNFSVGGLNSLKDTQFYENMRYPDNNISYKIYSCPVKKRYDMINAFEDMSNLTILNFYPVDFNEEISVNCNSKNKIEEGLFIAGEGGPSNITKIENFNIIIKGTILLLKDVGCGKPIVQTHELLHSLGFNHSNNPNNIMYPIAKCGQTVGDEIPSLINKLYSINSYPDLVLENVSAIMNGKYLDINISVRNNGLKKSETAKIIIYADEKKIKEIPFKGLGIGYGRKIILSNIWVPKISIKEIKVVLDYNLNELSKDNNQVLLIIS